MTRLLSTTLLYSFGIYSNGLDTIEGKHKLMGVNPKLRQYYEPVAPPQFGGHQFFQCDPLARSATELVPYENLNDDFCDCSNGADEPGTAACSHFPGAAFYCENRGSLPKLVWASHVGDGVCDCCDGSDEWQLGGCENFCSAEGAKIRQQREADLERIEAGLKQKEEERFHTDEKIALWTKELEELKAKLPGLETVSHTAQVELGQLEHEEHVKREAEAGAETGENNPEENDVSSGETEDTEDESEYAQWMEHEDDKDASSEPKEQTPVEIAREKANKLRAEVDDIKKEIEQHEKNLKTDFGPDYAYFSLANQCVEALFEHYNYKICFFGKVTQTEEGRSHSDIRLGEFSGYYTDPTKEGSPTDYSIHLFTNGDWCPGGPAREIKVKMRCGANLKLISVKEPSRCKYEAEVAHPGSCSTADVEALRKAIEEHETVSQEQYLRPDQYVTHVSEEL